MWTKRPARKALRHRVAQLGRPAAALAASLLSVGCFGSVSDPVRHYYTLHLEPMHAKPSRRVPGLLRVRDLDAEAAYDHFQLIVRSSPFELSYRQKQVWAVKPQRMISDLIARGLVEHGLFSGVTRELGERRPNYLLSGDLHAIEIVMAPEGWFAHLAMAWQISDFQAGKTLWSYTYDERQHLASNDFAQAVRCISQLLTQAIETSIQSMQRAALLDGPETINDTAAGTGESGFMPGMQQDASSKGNNNQGGESPPPSHVLQRGEHGIPSPRGSPAGMPPPGEPLPPPAAEAPPAPVDNTSPIEASPLRLRGAEAEDDMH